MIDLSVLRPLVWMDYRLAVLFTVLLPLALLLWAFVRRSEAIQRLLVIYWKVSSLLAITVYLMIGGFGVSFVAALMARLLIPVSLWFWVDLNEEIQDLRSTPLKLSFSAWRWSVTIYSLLGSVAQLLFLPCAFSGSALASDQCQVWLAAPLLYREYFHSGYTRGFLGVLGIIGLVVYVAVLGYFVMVRLGRQGRSAINQ